MLFVSGIINALEQTSYSHSHPSLTSSFSHCAVIIIIHIIIIIITQFHTATAIEMNMELRELLPHSLQLTTQMDLKPISTTGHWKGQVKMGFERVSGILDQELTKHTTNMIIPSYIANKRNVHLTILPQRNKYCR